MENLVDDFESLPLLDAKGDRFSSLSSPVSCPSLSHSFLSNTTSAFDIDEARRLSFNSPSTSPLPPLCSGTSTYVASPTTPLTVAPYATMNGKQYLKNHQDFNCPSSYSFSRAELNEDDVLWIEELENTSGLPQLSNLAVVQSTHSLDYAEHLMYGSEYLTYSISISDPALSRPIFTSSSQSDAVSLGGSEMTWPSTVSETPPQTIAPSETFQPNVASSPIFKHAPSTPLRRDLRSSAIWSSSPLSTLSTPVVPSQQDADELPYDVMDQWLSSTELRKQASHDRLYRRVYEPKKHCGPSSKPKPNSSRSGIDCDAVIALNEFACSYPGCIDKQTLKQKRFKRQEHKKRHEKTVHEKSRHGVHKCWVPLCKTEAFTRTDNLKSHLKNTHGKKSANQRNRYVATQDKNSEFFDPEWVGDLTADGYPIQ